jgi:antitoxin YefM
MNADDLDDKVIDSIKAMFRHKEIEIVVYERDETEYLLRSPVNREHLLSAVNDVDHGMNLITPSTEKFQ